ncbi:MULTISPECIES: branched-chain amino acid ABC transporter substrate-binding protein [unclassified Variovorax]|uniref:branched-chain amino acid ABC transporter substrate-binding protein n=1 Tax=unclassified Variovorax TaxID=663243 RepID=UPI00164E881B|nr:MULTISPECIES: branched-chain amino acid ABC transporter substrate-binding protein [unclassified Variovorax]MEB0057711.1 branched-chain amino acid ABC transporter substrate-binding protein [Variovorax sp. LG9.2]MEB0112999.1 branched-chain amino acid ABC transporter substrate-binding protein [Variovorax sp. RTB1]QNK73213.1 branched-chain amino acid ABC transporter substrate-binding protein [Variovorax sp. PAMC28562]
MQRLGFIRPVRSLLCVAALAACGVASAAETVKIAFIEVLSGAFAFTGQSSLNQLREVVAQLNANATPTDPKLEIVPFDGKGSPQESTVALKAASDQGIRYATQGGGSGVAFALVDAINKQADRDPNNAMVYLNYSAMDPGLTNDKCSFWHFRFYPSSEMQIEGLTTYLQKKPDVKKVFLFNQNYTHGQQVAKASRAYLARKRPDIQIVGEDYVPIATVRDFAPYVAKIAASGADTVITSNWGTDLGLLFKAAKDYNLNINFYTFNANNPGIPAQMGSWGVEKVNVMWNWGSNAPTPALEKIAMAYKKKSPEDDFIYASHWYTMNMLRAAMRQAKSTDPKKVAFALEGMKYESPVGEVEMRKVDHQMLAPIYLGVWAKQGSPGVKHDADNTGYGFRSEVVWDSYVSAQPTSCQMKRPPA